MKPHACEFEPYTGSRPLGWEDRDLLKCRLCDRLRMDSIREGSEIRVAPVTAIPNPVLTVDFGIQVLPTAFELEFLEASDNPKFKFTILIRRPRLVASNEDEGPDPSGNHSTRCDCRKSRSDHPRFCDCDECLNP